MLMLRTICAKCALEQPPLFFEDKPLRCTCWKCGAEIAILSIGAGAVYILTNPAQPGFLKIGHTTRPIHERIQELSSSTAAAAPFVLEAQWLTPSPEEDEHRVHECLAAFRYTAGREFFEIPLAKAISQISVLLGSRPHFSRSAINPSPDESTVASKGSYLARCAALVNPSANDAEHAIVDYSAYSLKRYGNYEKARPSSLHGGFGSDRYRDDETGNRSAAPH